MKQKKIKLLIMLLLLLPLCIALLVAGCEKNDQDSYENISLEYIKCPCDHVANLIKEVKVEDILLFDVSKTSFSEMEDLSFNGERSLFVCYTPETDSALVYSIRTTMKGVSYICNLPSEIDGWNISQKGDYISLSADEFELCEPKGAIASNTYSNYVLTSLKRKIK